MSHFKFTIQSPEVRELCQGVFVFVKGNYRAYFRLTDDGGHEAFSISLKLQALGMAQTTAAKLLKEAVAAGLIQQREPPVKPVATDDDEDEAKEQGWREQLQQRLQRRFQLTKSRSRHGILYGVWDDEYQREELVSQDRSAALAELRRRITEAELEETPMWARLAA